MNPAAANTTLLITMAGASSRFSQAGYQIPKYEIVVRGRTLFEWSMESLRAFIDAGCEFCFLCRESAGIDRFLQAQTQTLGIRTYQLARIPQLTDGQATTAMLARPWLRNETDAVAIYNIDTYVEPGAILPDDVRGNGWIPCFAGEGSKWSFALADGEGQVKELREKQRISPHATVGFYWFDSFGRYASAYERYYVEASRLEAGERYIAPLYNQLIHEGAEVFLHQVPAKIVHPLGTPEEVRAFERETVAEFSAMSAL